MTANHARETEVWRKIHKKGSGLPTVTNAQALDVALCWGWIDGIRNALDGRWGGARDLSRRQVAWLSSCPTIGGRAKPASALRAADDP